MKTYKVEVVAQKHYQVYMAGDNEKEAREKAMMLIHHNEEAQQYEYRDVWTSGAKPCEEQR